MKIVHIITRLIIGGAQENTLLSCQGQHRLGHDVTLIAGPAIGPEGSLLDRAQSHGYRVIVLDEMRRAIHPIRDFHTYRHLLRLLGELKPDIVHTHSSKAGILGRWAANRARIPAVVHTIHGLAFTASTNPAINWAYQMLEKRAAPLTTRIVCVADAMREQSLAAGIGRARQYLTIYSGMETEPFLHPPAPREQVRSSLGIAKETIVVGTIARLFDLKGHDDLLQIAPELCGQFPNLRFLWVGDGLLRPRLEAEMNRLGLRDRFILTGMVPPQRVPELTAAMDLLVHPSRREGLARALPQAALAAIPAIAYDIDGNREGLRDGITGTVLPPLDLRKLSDAIATLAGNESLRKSMGQAGRQFALGRFDAKGMVEALDRLYGEIRNPKSE
ncbi:MAG: glycosyltransferase family 4 protein [Tepidisphaeraceae bacterium]|jgi:glycosyltransferase involved in cell wall biosynthesis